MGVRDIAKLSLQARACSERATEGRGQESEQKMGRSEEGGREERLMKLTLVEEGESLLEL